jgi:hypothetical protein
LKLATTVVGFGPLKDDYFFIICKKKNVQNVPLLSLETLQEVLFKLLLSHMLLAVEESEDFSA